MNLQWVDQIAKAVLYEGYMLYPYRPSSVKNQQRWNFGVVYPKAYSDAQGGEEPSSMRIECLITGSVQTGLEVRLRFLHLRTRFEGRSPSDFLRRLPAAQRGPADVNGRVNGWQEAVERDVSLPGLSLELLLQGARKHFIFPQTKKLSRSATTRAGRRRASSRAAVEGWFEVMATRVLPEGLQNQLVRAQYLANGYSSSQP